TLRQPGSACMTQELASLRYTIYINKSVVIALKHKSLTAMACHWAKSCLHAHWRGKLSEICSVYRGDVSLKKCRTAKVAVTYLFTLLLIASSVPGSAITVCAH